MPALMCAETFSIFTRSDLVLISFPLLHPHGGGGGRLFLMPRLKSAAGGLQHYCAASAANSAVGFAPAHIRAGMRLLLQRQGRTPGAGRRRVVPSMPAQKWTFLRRSGAAPSPIVT